MPRKPQWLHRLPEIQEQVSALKVPLLDRSMMEKLFGLRRRQAVQLMHRFGGYRTGKTFLVERDELLRGVERLAQGDDFRRETRRRENLAVALDEARRLAAARAVKIAVCRQSAPHRVESLPEEIRLEPGRLVISFEQAEDLLVKLYQLSQTITEDFERFRTAAQRPQASQPDAARSPDATSPPFVLKDNP